jgi:hypothetical protein
MTKMKSIKPINMKRARRYLRGIWMEEENDVSVVSEDLPILKKGEFSFTYQDEEYAYVFGLKNLIDVSKDSGDARFVKPDSNSKDVEQLIVVTKGHHTITFEKMKQMPVYVRDKDGNKTIFIAHPIKKRVKLVNNDNGEKFEENLLSMFNYENEICVHCLLDRVDEFLQVKWDKIHGERKPSELYPGRVDKAFPKNYTRISYGKANVEAMKKEWDKLHGNKTPREVCPDRTDKEFLKEYDLDKIHERKKIDYIV